MLGFEPDFKSGCEANCVNACPPQWEITFGQNCYLWNATKLSWMEAEQFCRYLSLAMLLDVRSNYSLEVVKSTFEYFSTHVVIRLISTLIFCELLIYDLPDRWFNFKVVGF